MDSVSTLHSLFSPNAVPIFTHSMSSTYSVVSCNSPQCLQAPSDNYEPSGCSFKQNYVDGTTVSRSLGTDKLTFDTSDEGITSVPELLLGCATSVGVFSGQCS